MNVCYRVELSQAERDQLTTLLTGGVHAARKLKRAQILLAADAGVGDQDIAASITVGGSTVYRTKRRFVEGIWRPRSAKNLDPAQRANSPAKRRRSWWRPLAPPRPKAAHAGP